MPTSAKLRVAHVIGALVAGGAERFVVSLLRSLKDADLADVQLWVMANRMDGVGTQMRDMLQEAGIPCLCGPAAKAGLRTIGWYTKLVNDERPDIIHLHTPNTELLHYLSGFVGRKQTALIRTLHNTEQPTGKLILAAYRRNRIATSIACSQAAADASSKTVCGNIVTVKNGVEFNYPIRTLAVSSTHKDKLGLSATARHFVHIGRMAGDSLAVAQKAHDVVIRAWLQSGLGEQGCRLHLLGDGPLRPQLEHLANADPSIHFHGVRPNAIDWLIASDCFLMPSRYEGMPIAGIEAIGAGLSCIFSDLSCLRELLPPAASWVPVNDVETLATQMRFIAAAEAVVSTQSVEAFRERFSIASTASRYANLYVALIQAAAEKKAHARR